MFQKSASPTKGEKVMSIITREVTWGEALMVETSKNGGLRHIVDSITTQMGDQGTRNTFGKLLAVMNPAELKPRDQWRTWILLSAMDLDPIEWGIYPDVIPPHIDGALLRDRLVAAVAGIKAGSSD
jgi:hypothetical protein